MTILFLIFFVSTIVLGIITFNLVKPKYNEQIYIYDYFTETIMDDNLQYKTMILKVFADNGEIINLLDYNFDTYAPPKLLMFDSRKSTFIAESNLLRLYYEYDVKVISLNSYLSDNGFINLEYYFLDNGQVYFTELENEVYLDHNMATLYLNKNCNIGIRFRMIKQVQLTKV